jgi:phage gpG-like protein
MSKSNAAQAETLRALADQVEHGKPLPRELATALIEALEDREDVEAVRDWRARKARGEKTIPAAEVYRKLKV